MYHYRRCLCVVVSRAGLFTDDGLDFWGRIDDGLNLGQDCMYSVCGVDSPKLAERYFHLLRWQVELSATICFFDYYLTIVERK